MLSSIKKLTKKVQFKLYLSRGERFGMNYLESYGTTGLNNLKILLGQKDFKLHPGFIIGVNNAITGKVK